MVALIHLHGVTQGTGSSWDNGNLLNRCGIGLFGSHQSMSDFMIGNNQLLFVGEDGVLLLITGNDGFNTFFKVGLCRKASIITNRAEGSFIDNIRQFGTGSTGSHSGNLVEINIVGETNLLGMHLQDFFTAFQIRQFNRHTSVETSRTGQCRVKGFRSVGGSQDNNTCVALKTIHLCQQLVQRLFTFVIAANLAVTLLADGIDFIDENDTWGFFLRLFEKVTDFGSTHTYEHFDKFRTGHGEERYIGFAGHRLGKHGLTCSRRAYKKNAFRHGSTDFFIFIRIVEIIHDFCQVFLGFIFTGHIRELDTFCGFHINLGIALAHTKHHGILAAAHSVHKLLGHILAQGKEND